MRKLGAVCTSRQYSEETKRPCLHHQPYYVVYSVGSNSRPFVLSPLSFRCKKSCPFCLALCWFRLPRRVLRARARALARGFWSTAAISVPMAGSTLCGASRPTNLVGFLMLFCWLGRTEVDVPSFNLGILRASKAADKSGEERREDIAWRSVLSLPRSLTYLYFLAALTAN